MLQRLQQSCEENRFISVQVKICERLLELNFLHNILFVVHQQSPEFATLVDDLRAILISSLRPYLQLFDIVQEG